MFLHNVLFIPKSACYPIAVLYTIKVTIELVCVYDSYFHVKPKHSVNQINMQQYSLVVFKNYLF
jgi:hypothetical protein